MPNFCKDRCRYPERLAEVLGIEVAACNPVKFRYPCRHYSACATCEIMLTSYFGLRCPCCMRPLRRSYFPDGRLTSRGRGVERERQNIAMRVMTTRREPNKCSDCGVGLLDHWTKRCGPCKRAYTKDYHKRYRMASHHRKRAKEAEVAA